MTHKITRVVANIGLAAMFIGAVIESLAGSLAVRLALFGGACLCIAGLVELGMDIASRR